MTDRHLVGTKSNRDGIGAKLLLTLSSGKVEHGFVSTAGSYLSANDKRVYFGLGADVRINQLEVDWPSGTKQIIQNPPTRQVVTITEK